MHRTVIAKRFEHIIFPREEKRRHAINLAPATLTPILPRETFNQNCPQDEADFLDWLLQRAGLDARHYRPETLQRRLSACFRAIRATSVHQARAYLESNPVALPTAVSSLLVGVTSFFRDPLVFEQLRSELERFRADGKRKLNIWSIGCSEGAELYSLAMLLAELNLLEQSYLLGTDCRVEAIDHARLGAFELSAGRQIPAELGNKYLERNGKCLRISELLRRSVRWRVSSIVAECEPGIWDMILFRNTALYLRPEVVLPLWSKLECALKTGGLLVLGRAERPHGAQRFRAIGPCVYRRQPR